MIPRELLCGVCPSAEGTGDCMVGNVFEVCRRFQYISCRYYIKLNLKKAKVLMEEWIDGWVTDKGQEVDVIAVEFNLHIN